MTSQTREAWASMYFSFDPSYWVIMAPALILGIWAQWHVTSTFNRYARVPTATGVNGEQVAMLLMERTGHRFGVVHIPGMLTDYYDPSRKVMCLSESSVQNSVASVAVVAHEFGHAVQDVEGYTPMKLRSALVPAVKVGGWVGPLIFVVGLTLSSLQLAWAGLILFSATAVFAIATLPVELNASSRALTMLRTNGILTAQELPGAQAVLSAAALTYLAAIVQAVLQLLYFASLLSRRR